MDTTTTVILLVIFLGIFLMGREVVCWYWKITKGITLMEEILKELKKANENSVGHKPKTSGE
jgi:hypothetical protein